MQGDNKSTPAASFDYNGCSSPSYDSYYELEEDLRTFEEKYKILESVVLGEVSSLDSCFYHIIHSFFLIGLLLSGQGVRAAADIAAAGSSRHKPCQSADKLE